MSKKPIIIDTDPGIDDAVAIAIALFNENLDVRLITTVAGNVSIDLVTSNCLKLLKFFKKEIPVAKGAHEPLLETFEDASNVHGASGMDGFEFDGEATHLLMDKHAVEAMRDEILNSKEKITLVPIGPLTNIALLLKTYPEVKPHIEEIVLMGGSASRGNRTVMAEFNIATDPEAAKIVFNSGLNIVMAGLDVGLKALVLPEDSKKLPEMGEVGKMIFALFSKYRGGSMKTGLKMYDSCAIAYLLEPSMYEVVETHIDVETSGEMTRGVTLVDLKGYMKRPNNAKVLLDIDGEKFREWFYREINNCN